MSITGFGSQEVTNHQQQLSLNGSLPLSLLNNEITTANTGSVQDTASEYRVRHQAAGDFAALQSVERGRYISGYELESGIGIRLESNTIPDDGVITIAAKSLESSSIEVDIIGEVIEEW